MSIIALAIRMAATRALETEGATLAGARVFDSAITPLDEMVSAEPKPMIVVSTEDDSAEVGGADWNSGGRTDLLKFFLFLRKRRWDLWLCVQNVNVIDKQVRESIAEHVVYINRLDRIKLPFPVGPLLRVLSLGIFKGRLPKMHQAIVKYGAKYNSPKVDDWFYRGEEFYSYYDTTQEYDKAYDKGSYSMLPPGYWRRPVPTAQRNAGFYMRTTKIFFKRFGVINARNRQERCFHKSS